MEEQKPSQMSVRITALTDEELVEEYVDLCIWKNFALGDWGTGDWGHLNALYSELEGRSDDLSDTIIELYKVKADETRKELEEESANYGREQFDKDMEDMFK